LETCSNCYNIINRTTQKFCSNCGLGISKSYEFGFEYNFFYIFFQ